jgi:hypothetical protein
MVSCPYVCTVNTAQPTHAPTPLTCSPFFPPPPLLQRLPPCSWDVLPARTSVDLIAAQAHSLLAPPSPLLLKCFSVNVYSSLSARLIGTNRSQSHPPLASPTQMDERLLYLSDPEIESVRFIGGIPTPVISFEVSGRFCCS